MKTTESLANVVKEVQSGNNDSFEKLYYESYKYLHTCVINIVKDENTAEDMLQEAYTEIFKSISQLNNPYDFLSWAATIANRKCFAYIKKQKDVLVGENTDEEGNETDYFESIPDDEAFIPENILDDQEKIKIIRGIIDDLTDIQRACVIGFYYNDQKQEEIASELNIPVNTVKSHLSRAKAKIKDAVGETEKKQGIKLFAIPAFLSLLFAKQTEVYAAEMAVPAMGAALSSAVSTASTTAAAVTSAGEASAATSTATVSSLGEASVTASTTAETVAGAAAKGAATKAIAGAAAKGAATKAVAGTAVKAAAMAVKTKIIIAAAVGAVTIASVGGGTAVAVTEHHKTVEREARIQRELEEREKKAKEEERLKAEAESKAASEAALVAEQTDANAGSDAVLSEEKDPMMEKIARAYIKAIEEYISSYENGDVRCALIYILPTDYPQLVISDYSYDIYTDYSLFSVNNESELICLDSYTTDNLSSLEYYEKQGMVGREEFTYERSWGYYLDYLNEYGSEDFWSYDRDTRIEAKYNEYDEAINGYYTSWLDDFGECGKSESNKTFEECEEELKRRVGGAEPISFGSLEYMSKDEMIAYLKTFLSDDEGDFAEGEYEQGDISEKEWKMVYKKEITSGNINYPYLDMAYVNDDDIPEIVCRDENYSLVKVYTYHNGEVNGLDLYGHDFDYIPHKNSVIVSNEKTGVNWEWTVFTIQNGEWILIGQGGATKHESGEWRYTWDGKDVGDDYFEFKTYVDKVYDVNQGYYGSLIDMQIYDKDKLLYMLERL